MSDEEILLRMEGISKRFPGVKALDNVQFTLHPGTVHALMGENGAGKSTLMKCLFGIYMKDSGHIFLEGNEVEFHSSKEALEHGVAMVHQELNQALKRNVMDNIWLGRYPLKSKAVPLVDEKKMYEDTMAIFKELGIQVNPRTIMRKMPVSQRQMVEIAKAVSYHSKVIVFDEPTSSLTEEEVKHLFSIIRMLKKRNVGIIYISHKMSEIKEISDEITIMRDGQYITTRPTADISMDEIIKLMVGRELTNVYPPRVDVRQDSNMLEVKNITAEYARLYDVSFSLKKGEILGIAGLDGSGRTSLLECIFGSATRHCGTIFHAGKQVYNRTPREAIRNGFAMVTEERRATGIFSILSVRDNMVIASLKRYCKGLLLSDTLQTKAADEMIKAMHTKTPSQKTKMQNLSGGNQQKIILGRWLLTQPDILLLDEPTRGIDVGAKFEIYELIQAIAKQDKSIIMVSSEMQELLGVCNRILVMSNGRLAGELNPMLATQEDIMTLAAKFM